MPTPFQIRPLKVQDAPALAHLAGLTFKETFWHNNDPVSMQQYLEENLTPERLQTELQTLGSHFFFVEDQNQPVGYLKINQGAAQTESQWPDALEIERIYLLANHQNRGIGKRLLDHALQIGKETGCTKAWLGVWEHNPGAIRFYERNGFRIFSKHVFQLGDEAQTDLLMHRPF